MEPLWIGVDLQAGRQLGRDALAARLGAERPNQRLQQLAQRDPPAPKLEPPVIQVREVEQVVDEPGQRPRAGVDLAAHLRHGGWIEPMGAVDEQLGVAMDQAERRS